MAIALLQIQLYLPGSRSLKEKRSRVKPVLSRLRREFNLSCAEIGLQDVHDRAELGMVIIASDPAVCAATLEHAVQFLSLHFADEVILDQRIHLL